MFWPTESLAGAHPVKMCCVREECCSISSLGRRLIFNNLKNSNMLPAADQNKQGRPSFAPRL